MKAVIIAALLAGLSGPAHDRQPAASMTPWPAYEEAAGRNCKSVSTCQEAVELWCGGYSRADGDHDGIPCETVCSSKAEVDEIKASIGC